MTLFTEHERNILKRFKESRRVITEEEKRVIDKWSSIGFASNDYDWENDYPTAKLSKICLTHLYL